MSDKKAPASVVPLSARGIKSALSSILLGLQNRSIDAATASAAAKVAAQMNNIMRTELDAAKLHHELTGEKGSHALVAIGYPPPETEA